MFSKDVHDAFKLHAQQAFPNEACGLVVTIDGVTSYRACDNVAEDPQQNFLMPGEQYVRATEEGIVEALLHSHTPFIEKGMYGHEFERITMHPTKPDVELQLQLEIPFGIGLCNTAELCGEPFYFGDQVPMAPLVGRQYMFNHQACFHLARDYFRTREVNPVFVPNFAIDDEWWKRGEDVFSEHLAASCFREIPTDDVRVGDVCLMRVKAPVINHVGVLIEPDLLLHHLQGHLSAREPMSRYLPFVVKWVRHEGDF